jgi:hypothetical protein
MRRHQRSTELQAGIRPLRVGDSETRRMFLSDALENGAGHRLRLSHPGRPREHRQTACTIPRTFLSGADCGFASFAATCEVHPSVVWVKLKAFADGTQLATRQLWRMAA